MEENKNNSGQSIRISASLAVFVLGIIISLISVIYGITVNNFSQANAATNIRVDALASQFDKLTNLISTVNTNVAILCASSVKNSECR